MRWLGATLGLLSACIRPMPDAAPGPLEGGPPAITGLDLQCDPASDRFSLRVRTDAWAGSARLWLGQGIDAVEFHRGASVAAAADGSADCLQLTLAAAEDPEEARPDATTRFRCTDFADLSVLVSVTALDASTVTDCRSFGADPTLWERVPQGPACATPLTPEDTGQVRSFTEGDLADCPAG